MASALTNLHPGAGRAPGSVDLPVARDSMGIPVVWGTMVKGALKSAVAIKRGCLAGVSRGDREEHIVKCDGEARCKSICCLLGGEPGAGSAGASAVSIQDLYPLLIPAPAYVLASNGSKAPCNLGGVVYVTTKTLLARALAYAEASGNRLADTLKEAVPEGGGGAAGGIVYCGGYTGSVKLVLAGSVLEATAKPPTAELGGLDDKLGLGDLNPLYKVYPVHERLLILDDEIGRSVINRLLVRVSRVALDRETKTVRGGHLWTEEYLPWGTLFLGLAFETGYRNDYCEASTAGEFDPLKSLEELLGEIGRMLSIGGKESVGAGLLKIRALASGGGQGDDKP